MVDKCTKLTLTRKKEYGVLSLILWLFSLLNRTFVRISNIIKMASKLTIAVLFIFIAFSGVNAQSTGYKNVKASEFKSMMEKKKGVLIDLRTQDEIRKGKIKGAEEIDFLSTDAEEKIKKLDKKKTYYIYCAGGGRSGDCADLMVKNGFKNIVNLEKGFSDWKKAGFEIETK